MTHISRIAFVGNSLPRRCGIATFTTDLQQSIAAGFPAVNTAIVAMNDHGRSYDYPSVVSMEIDADTLQHYGRAAKLLNVGRFDVVSLQHEFGIFGGEAGEDILELISRLAMPVVTTLHTVLARPTFQQRAVIDGIVAASAKVVVMAEKGRELLRDVYHVPAAKIEVIRHGIPDAPFAEPDTAKTELGFAGKPVILTFGLLSPNKGIEVMIDAMPAILKQQPDAVYVVLGATHPNLVLGQGEVYREGLIARAKALGIAEHVIFLDQFVDHATLLRFISMCDVYVTPYLNEAQMTSGTLAYSFGMGKAVVSTPYWHARELLADDHGVLVPFGDVAAIGDAIAGLLTDPDRRQAMRHRAFAASRPTTWARTAQRYMDVFEGVCRPARPKVIAGRQPEVPVRPRAPLPAMQFEHLMAMCDDTGIYQHAVHCVPDRLHGYCVDDNARALLLACTLMASGGQALPEPRLVSRFAAFVQHAWNPDTRRFRNFMSFDRRWLEDRGSEDSHGRTLWALGECARSDANPARQAWAKALFAEALPTVEAFTSPRAWAFTLLGLAAYCVVAPSDLVAVRLRVILAERLVSLLGSVETTDWVWFEPVLSYDNARLPQALIVTGEALADRGYIDAGLQSLRWLMRMQTSPTGCFRPVGSSSFGAVRTLPEPFDQQPLEATAAISACLAAWRVDHRDWKAEANRAFTWFLGNNDLSIPLVDLDTGSCRDGLHPDRANENRGGESVLSYLIGLAEMHRLSRMSGDRSNVAAAVLALA